MDPSHSSNVHQQPGTAPVDVNSPMNATTSGTARLQGLPGAPPGVAKGMLQTVVANPSPASTQAPATLVHGVPPTQDGTPLLVAPAARKPGWPLQGGQAAPAQAGSLAVEAGGLQTPLSAVQGNAVPGTLTDAAQLNQPPEPASGAPATGTQIVSNGTPSGEGVTNAVSGQSASLDTASVGAGADGTAVDISVKRKVGVSEVEEPNKNKRRVLSTEDINRRNRETQLRDFLLSVKEYGSTVPVEAAKFHLQKGGLSTSSNDIVTLMALATDHLLAKIVHDSSRYRNLRLQRSGEQEREHLEVEEEDGKMLTNEDLSLSLGERGIHVADSETLVRCAGPAVVAAAAAASVAAEVDGLY